MAYSGSSTPRFGADSTGTLRLLSYLALAVVLMVSDHRGGVLSKVRHGASVAVEPLWWLAALPPRAIGFVNEAIADQTRLNGDNVALQRQHLLDQARLVRMQAVVEENRQLRALLGGTRGNRLNVQLASIVDIDLDPERQQVVLDVGADRGAHPGQAVIDAGGVIGQVMTVTSTRSTVLLVTDPDHAVPAQAVRSGLRMIVYGNGHSGRLLAPNIPRSGDLRVGDALITSGIGGRFPAGFPVGTVTALTSDPNHAFVEATIAPAAHLDRSGEVLLVGSLPDTGPDIGPPVPTELATLRAAAALAQRASTTHPVTATAAPQQQPPPTPQEPKR